MRILQNMHTGAEDQTGRHGKLHHLIHHGHEEKPAAQASGELHGQDMPDESGWTAADQDTLLKEMQRQQGRPIDWDAVIKVLPHKTKKECALWLVRMGAEHSSSSDSSDTVLRAGGRVELMQNDNPTLERIVLMTNSVHPSAVAYFAGNAQQQVQDAKAGSAGSASQPLQQACRNALKQVQENAKAVVKHETERIEELVLEEAKLTVKKMELKIKHVKELHEMIEQEDRRREEVSRAAVTPELLHPPRPSSTVDRCLRTGGSRLRGVPRLAVPRNLPADAGRCGTGAADATGVGDADAVGCRPSERRAVAQAGHLLHLMMKQRATALASVTSGSAPNAPQLCRPGFV